MSLDYGNRLDQILIYDSFIERQRSGQATVEI